MPEPAQLSVLTGAIIVGAVSLVAKIVFDWLQTRRNNRERCIYCVEFRTLCSNTQKLMDLHDRRDDDGIPVWYVPRSVTKTLNEVLEATNHGNGLLGQILEQLRARPL